MIAETDRLIIKELTMDMADDIWINSLDEDNRRFVPDEVFETKEEAIEVIEYLIKQYEGNKGPLLYVLITKKDNKNIGYVQIVPLDETNYEIGYHIAKKYTCLGYASEAIKVLIPLMFKKIGINQVMGIVLKDNIASIRVLEKCGFTKVFDGIGKYQNEDKAIVKYIYKSEDGESR